MRVAFLGTGDIGVPSLKALAMDGRHEVCAVFTQPDRPAGRAMKLKPSPIKVAAEELGIPVYQPEKIRVAESLEQLAALKPEIIVVVAYGQILPKRILELPPRGCLNIHASILPKHRGASPVHAAILAGDTESGVTIMQMDEGLDTGDILHVASVSLAEGETAGSLHDRLAELAPGALVETLRLIEAGTVVPMKQDDSLATYAPKLSRKDGEIDWRQPAEEIERRIRGLTPWPGAYTYLPEGTAPLKVHAAAALDGKGGGPGEILDVSQGLLVAAGEGAVLLREIQAPGGKRLAATDFLRGHEVRVGEKISGPIGAA